MNEHLLKLKSITGNKEANSMFPCIEDIVINGLSLSRFTDNDPKPSRQVITQYLAAWFKYIGISEAQCIDWMMDYCVDKLSHISQSSLSRIRHSTKGNIKYIFNGDVNFNCECENNIFKAPCAHDCVMYEEMQERYIQNKKLAEAAKERLNRATEMVIPFVEKKLSLRDKYRDQFNEAMELAQKYIQEGMTKVQVLAILNERGYKTARGENFNYSNLLGSLSTLRAKSDIPVRKKYRDQFKEAMELAEECKKEGMTNQQLVSILNERGYKTKLGENFTYSSILRYVPQDGSLLNQEKEKYRDQFKEAMEVAGKCLREGIKKVQVVAILNERGYKTKTGNNFTYSIFTNEWSIYSK